MKLLSAVAIVAASSTISVPLAAQDAGTATGKGTIERVAPSGSEQVPFSPRYAFSYVEGAGARKSTWIVLTEKQPPLAAWSGSKNKEEARRAWCEKEKTSFVAVKLDQAWKVDLYFLCPANGSVNTEMLNTANGLDSVALTFAVRDATRVKGTLKTGQGSCPGPGGSGQAYCTATGDYTFDAVMIK